MMTDKDWQVALEIVLDMRQTLTHMNADLATINETFDRIEARMACSDAMRAERNSPAPQRQ